MLSTHSFDLYDKEARRLLAKRLPIPAYDHLLKLSHTFNIMDARGAVGVTERADCFATLRGLAREITGKSRDPGSPSHVSTNCLRSHGTGNKAPSVFPLNRCSIIMLCVPRSIRRPVG